MVHLHHIHLRRFVMPRYDHKAQIRWELKGLNEEIDYLKRDRDNIQYEIDQKILIRDSMTGRDMQAARQALHNEISGLISEKKALGDALQERYARRNALKNALKSP